MDWGLVAGVVLIGFVHGVLPDHGWPIAATYALNRPRKWLYGTAAGLILGIGHLVSSVALVLAYFWFSRFAAFAEGPWLRYVAGTLLILLGVREYRYGGHGHAGHHDQAGHHGQTGHHGQAGHHSHTGHHGHEENHQHDLDHGHSNDRGGDDSHGLEQTHGPDNDHGQALDHELDAGHAHSHRYTDDHSHGLGYRFSHGYSTDGGHRHRRIPDPQQHLDHDRAPERAPDHTHETDHTHRHGHIHDHGGEDSDGLDHAHDPDHGSGLGHSHSHGVGHDHSHGVGHDHSQERHTGTGGRSLRARIRELLPGGSGHQHLSEEHAERGLVALGVTALLLGFAHEEPIQILAICVGTVWCLELMLVYSLAVIVAILVPTLLLIAGYQRHRETVETYTPYLPALTAVVLVGMGLAFIVGVF